jgi:hypothetical protein
MSLPAGCDSNVVRGAAIASPLDSGASMRSGVGLFGRKKKDLTETGVQGTAVVKDVGVPQYPHTDRDNVHLSDFGLGSTLYPLRRTTASPTRPAR